MLNDGINMHLLTDPTAIKTLFACFPSASDLEKYLAEHPTSRVRDKIVRDKSQPGEVYVVLSEYKDETTKALAESADIEQRLTARRRYVRAFRASNAKAQAKYRDKLMRGVFPAAPKIKQQPLPRHAPLMTQEQVDAVNAQIAQDERDYPPESDEQANKRLESVNREIAEYEAEGLV